MKLASPNPFLIKQLLAAAYITSIAYAAPVTKHTAGTDLALGASWNGGLGPAPTSIDDATWSGSSLGGALTVGSAVNWGGINITGASANINISGSQITTGNITLAGTKTLSIANTIALSGNSIYTIADVTSSTATDATLGAISGASRGFTKEGAGTLVLTGNNTFTGTLNVNQGTLTSTGGALTGPYTTNTAAVNIASGATLNLSGGGNNQLETKGVVTIGGTLAATTNVANSIRGTSIILDNGGTLTSTVTNNTSGYGAFFVNTLAGATTTITAKGTGNVISGSGVIGIQSGATLALNTALSGDALSVTGTIGQGANGTAGALTKAGAGTVTFTGANTYTGRTTVNGGTLEIATGGSLLNLAEHMVLGDTATPGSTFALTGGAVTLASTSSNFYSANQAGGDSVVNLSVGTLNVGGLFVNGVRAGSTLNISGTANATFGTLSLGLSGGVATGTRTVNVLTGGTLTLNNGVTYGQGTHTVNLNGGTLKAGSASGFTWANNANVTATIGSSGFTMDTQANSASIAQTLGGTGALTKSGSGTLTLTGTNTYTGATTINAGTLKVDGSTHASSTVGISTAGTLSGTGTINGNTTLTGNGIINKASGTIAGTLAVTGGNWNGAGTVTGAVTSSSGTFTIGSGANLTSTAGVSVTGGSLASGSSTSTITGSVNYTSGTSSSFGGVIAGSGKTLTMNNSAATLTLTNTSANSYTGATSVNAGKLVINGNISSSSLTTVNNTGTLGGSGTVGALTVANGGTLAPGNSPGILNAGDTNLQAGSNLTMELNGLTAGTGYDQLNVTGTVSLAGALSLTMSSPPVNDTLFFILANDGVDAIVGNFSNAAINGSTYSFGGQDFQISYFGNYTGVGVGGTFTGGNDVVLMAVPEPNAAALLGSLGLLALLRRRRQA